MLNEAKKSGIQKLLNVQTELKVPKDQLNKFANFRYRSAEQIIEEAKIVLQKNKMVLNLQDEIVQVGERIYVKAIVTVYDTESDFSLSSTGFARESENKKGMDDSQITGTASSYARKYALNGLFAIDDTKDADTDEYQKSVTKDPKKLSKLTELFDNLDVAVQKAVLQRYKVKEIQQLPVDLWDRAIEGMSK